MRPHRTQACRGSHDVSIHAPWEGCDSPMNVRAMRWALVSIHAPWEGCDGEVASVDLPAGGFQFTHPGKGATLVKRAPEVDARVSIHAPWEGCDYLKPTQRLRGMRGFNSRTLGRVRRCMRARISSRCCFNSRTLGRVRRVFPLNNARRMKFQFTHPGKGATAVNLRLLAPRDVSIHAPWEGCDLRTPRTVSLS